METSKESGKNALIEYIEQYMPLTSEEKSSLEGLNLFREYKKGEVLLKEGAYSKETYFVLKGCLRSYYIHDAEEITTEFYTELEGVSPACSQTDEASEYFIDCVEDSLVSVGTQDMEEDMFQKFPRFESLCRILSEKLLLKQQTAMVNYKTSSPEQRYLQLMETNPGLVHRVPQYQIASYLGIKPESLSRIRKRIMQKAFSAHHH
ncbi:CRP-like cAMP-binding protein [Dyadobacter jejuensis]|uniref:CRP-like cAMP-binding protein n=1 Tax=Dyadobacter jejuensis TaxID=1082580 RepID=A0A316ALS1_9BACT|nr:Crp/Fnr family transcriptional regulator [Dyadobacter jejuensis]PWJ58703.1 CRP-like cAMP-binding protein [Dyadobacter jejuensis]